MLLLLRMAVKSYWVGWRWLGTVPWTRRKGGFNTPSGHTQVPLRHNPIPFWPHLLRSKLATCLEQFCHLLWINLKLGTIVKSPGAAKVSRAPCTAKLWQNKETSLQKSAEGKDTEGPWERPEMKVELRTTVRTILWGHSPYTVHYVSGL